MSINSAMHELPVGWSYNEYYAAIKMSQLQINRMWKNLTDTRLNKRNQTQQKTYCMTPFISNSKRDKINYFIE